MTLNGQQAARYAALIMYAWDMCDAGLHNLKPVPDARIAADGWRITGFITGSDDVVKAGDGIRTQVLRASSDENDRVCYGFLAQNQDGMYAAVIRGTDGAEEWADDFDFLLRLPKAPLQGMVESGFYEIFDSMNYQPVDGSPPTRLANGISQVVGSAPVIVLGHSLGAAISTYLVAELADRPGAPNASACLFASPKPGNAEFASYFASKVKDYVVYNFESDVVPATPPLGYSAVPNCTVIKQSDSKATIGADKKCCHHLISYIALLDVNEFKRVVALQGTTPDDCKCAACVSP
jgi:triacylglycerol lipase